MTHPASTGTGDYSLSEVQSLVERLLSELGKERVTGQLVLTLHARNGGIARIDATRQVTFQRSARGRGG